LAIQRIPTLNNRLRRRERLSSSSHFHIQACQLSSTPQGPSCSIKATKTTSKLDPPPPPKPKSKVELRPGPVKTLPSTSKPVSLPPLPKTNSQPTPHPTVSTSEFEAALSQREIIDNATQHGVLAPAPVNATWLGTKFHTIKEFAVCPFEVTPQSYLALIFIHIEILLAGYQNDSSTPETRPRVTKKNKVWRIPPDTMGEQIYSDI
jgi:hypothetical protein